MIRFSNIGFLFLNCMVIALLLLLLLLLLPNPIYGQTCSAKTKSDLLGPFYIENSKNTSDMAPSNELSDPTKRLEVSGHVFSTKDCSSGKYYPMANVTIEAWYAGTPDSSLNYYQDTEYRGQIQTNSCGKYTFVQSFPKLYPDRPILHTHIRLSNNEGTELLVTQMYFKGRRRGYYNRWTIATVLRGTKRDLQATTIKTLANGTRQVTYNIYIDSTANKQCSALKP